eukprot:scpid62877/ scgid0043/ 
MATSGGHPSPDADKADGAGVSKCLGEGQKGVEHSGEVATLEFDPENSYALCVGTDSQLRDSPAEMSTVLTSVLGLAQDHIIVLSEAAATDSATEENVKARLSEQAAKVKDTGILFFSFSGHGGRKKPDENVAENVAENVDENVDEIEEFYIAAADPQRMGASLFVDSLGTCKGRNAVIVMDCCYAGGLLENIRQSKWKNSFNVYTLAASKRNEKTFYFADLGPSLFTFFMACYLEKNATLGKLPIRSSMDYCRSLCPAFARLVYMTDEQKVELKAGGKSTIPNPIYDYRPKTTESGEKAPLIKSHLHPLTSSFINKLMDDPDDYVLPAEVCTYFNDTAVQNVQTLYEHGYLSPGFDKYNAVLDCVLRLLVQSSARILLDLQKQPSDVDPPQPEAAAAAASGAEEFALSPPGHPDVFLRVLKYVLHVFEALSSVPPKQNLVQLRHVALMASKYVRSTKEFRMVELLPSAQEAITFWNMVYRAHKKVYKQPVEKLSTLLDDPDGTTLDHVKDLASLPELCRLIAQNLDILAKSKEEK